MCALGTTKTYALKGAVQAQEDFNGQALFGQTGH